MTENLQEKYEMLDMMYVGKEDYVKVWDKLQEMDDKINNLKNRSDSYGEESGTMNESLEEINSKELGGDDDLEGDENGDSLNMKRNDDTKSQKSF